ncbi:MAG: MerR family transcriptional regulator [Thiotrichaceae bacterium]
MYIGPASKKSGATVKAIRLYEELGLLRNISRENSYRIFTDEDVLLIKFIKIAQTFDFKLSELKEIIYQKGEPASWENIREAITLKEKKITNEILRLQENKEQLQNYNQEIEQCLLDNSNCVFPLSKNHKNGA